MTAGWNRRLLSDFVEKGYVVWKGTKFNLPDEKLFPIAVRIYLNGLFKLDPAGTPSVQDLHGSFYGIGLQSAV